MRIACHLPFWILLGILSIGTWASAQPPQAEILDGIVVRIEDDVITLSEVRELAAYQQLLDGHSQTNDELRSELIEQWVVNSEATAARFPSPAETEVDREAGHVESSFANPGAYRQRLAAVGLTPDTVRRIIRRQIYLARYLDYKFRSSIQIDDEAIANYYRDHLMPELQAKGQPAPPLADVSVQIREVLIERGINDRTAAWFNETKPRLRIELEPMDAFSISTPGNQP
jgi:hypothetical protein